MGQIQYGRERSFKSTNDLSAKQYFILKLDTTQNQVVLAAAATDNIIGILRNAPVAGDIADVTLIGSVGTQKVVASGAISLGAFVTADSNGRAVATTTSGDHVIGVALEAAAAQGDLIEILLTNYKY